MGAEKRRRNCKISSHRDQSKSRPPVVRQLPIRTLRHFGPAMIARLYCLPAAENHTPPPSSLSPICTFLVMASVGGKGGAGVPPAVVPDDAAPTASAGESQVQTRPPLTVESSDVLRLIQHHLTECGLHGAARALREESGVGAAGVHRSGLLRTWAREGRWADVLECLERLDAERCGLKGPGLKVRVLCMCYVLCHTVCHARVYFVDFMARSNRSHHPALLPALTCR